MSNTDNNHFRRIQVPSFPKCGKTWLRFMVGQLLASLAETDVKTAMDHLGVGGVSNQPLAPGLPIVHIKHGYQCSEISKGRPFPLDFYRNQHVMLLARDPRDVVVSNFLYEKYQHNRFEGDFQNFLDCNAVSMSDDRLGWRFGLRPIINHLNGFAASRHEFASFKVLRYEDLRADTPGELSSVAEFMGLPATQRQIDDSVAFASFENMRALEASGEYTKYGLKGGKDPRSHKVRKGVVGGHRETLTDTQRAEIEAFIERELDPFYAEYAAQPVAG